jgi:heterodisulfide reductase subunit C
MLCAGCRELVGADELCNRCGNCSACCLCAPLTREQLRELLGAARLEDLSDMESDRYYWERGH